MFIKEKLSSTVQVLWPSGRFEGGSPKLSDFRLFGMYHSKTPQHNKDVIITSLTNVDGVVRVVFATMALGMGIDCVGLTQTIHYGSIDDYFQECGRAGRGGASTMYWKPSNVPQRKATRWEKLILWDGMWRIICRRFDYFDPARPLPKVSKDVTDWDVATTAHSQTPWMVTCTMYDVRVRLHV